MAQEHAGAVIVGGQPENFYYRRAIVGRAAEARLPMTYLVREFVDDRGLMSYGTNLPDAFRRLVGYVDSVLRGAKPGDLPIHQATRLELVLNMKTAKALGLTISPWLLVSTDEMIE
jgi:putative ABC transport system substrate-binding protein